MKKITLLVVLFLTACTAVSNPTATPTPTETPTRTPTRTPIPATVTSSPTLTLEPTATITETKGAPAKVETQVDKIPFESSDYLFSPEFAAQVLKDEAAGKFPRNPNAKPLTSINVLPVENQAFFKEYGVTSIFVISKEDAQIYSNDSKNKPWSLAAIYQSELQGEKFYYALVRWENKDGTVGFTANIVLPKDPNIKDLMFDSLFDDAFGSGPHIPRGNYFDLSRDTIDKYFALRSPNGKIFADWYRSNPGIVFNKLFWQQCEDNGVIKNEITNSNGQKESFIPVSPLGVTSYGK